MICTPQQDDYGYLSIWYDSTPNNCLDNGINVIVSVEVRSSSGWQSHCIRPNEEPRIELCTITKDVPDLHVTKKFKCILMLRCSLFFCLPSHCVYFVNDIRKTSVSPDVAVYSFRCSSTPSYPLILFLLTLFSRLAAAPAAPTMRPHFLPRQWRAAPPSFSPSLLAATHAPSKPPE